MDHHNNSVRERAQAFCEIGAVGFIMVIEAHSERNRIGFNVLVDNSF